MEKQCLVIMPQGNPDGYDQGHFNRVYEYVIAPACRAADFMPARVEDAMATNGEVLDVIKIIVESEIAICDLSTRNKNVAYGFAIRNVLNLPVVLVKDLKTQMIPAGEDFVEVTYDESLRIDTVQAEIATLTEALKRTYKNKGEEHSLLSRLDPEQVEVQAAAQGEDAQKEKSFPIISPLPDYVGDPFTEDEINKLKVGDGLFHLTRGKGVITSLKKTGHEKLAGIKFESGSTFLILGATEYFRKLLE